MAVVADRKTAQTIDDNISRDSRIRAPVAKTVELEAHTAANAGYVARIWSYLQYHLWFELTRQVRIEQAQRGGFLWLPVFLALGSLIYFSLPREPMQFAFPLLGLGLLMTCWALRTSNFQWVAVVPLMVTLGISLAQWRSHSTSTNTLKSVVVAEAKGRIIKIEPRADGRVRYTLTETQIEGVGRPLARVRVTARKEDGFDIGDTISGRARLAPPPGPALPGGYDFGFFAWFDQIGASGFFLGAPQRSRAASQTRLSMLDKVSNVRLQIANLLQSNLGPQTGALASALIIGERSRIDEATTEALRKSGLAHILAISGLHMALVTLTVVGTVRLLLATTPRLVVYVATKKIAGSLGLISATIYLFLSGASLSTQRAYIMVVVMLLATLMDRKALTMRNVAIAAILVLLMSPNAILQPGFQMSFAAAAALIGTYERVAEYRLKRNSSPPSSTLGNWMYAIRQNIFGMILVPVIAGLATALFAAYHFYRIAPLGLLANFLAMPIVSFAVMPLALLSVLLMPFGLEQFTLPMLGVSLKSVVDIAAWVADLGPSGSTGKISRAALLWGSLGLIIATLARSRLKLVAIPCLAVAIAVARAPSPLFLVSESGRQVAILSAPGVVITSKPNAEKFITGIWKQAYGQHIKPGRESNKTNRDQPVRNCDTFGCTLKTAGLTLTHLSNTARLATDCLRADILVVPYSVPWACEFLPTEDRPLIIDRRRLQRFGAHAIHLTKTPETRLAEPIEIITARSGARRPWSTD